MPCLAGERVWTPKYRTNRPCLRASAHRSTGRAPRADGIADGGSDIVSRSSVGCRLPPAAARAAAGGSRHSEGTCSPPTVNRRQLGGAALSTAAAAALGLVPLPAAAVAAAADGPAAADRLRETKVHTVLLCWLELQQQAAQTHDFLDDCSCKLGLSCLQSFARMWPCALRHMRVQLRSVLRSSWCCGMRAAGADATTALML